jgi:hypothetical protein
LVAYGTGKAELLRGDLGAAEESFKQALKDSAETSNRRVMMHSLQALAVCSIQSGRVGQAVRIHGLTTSRDWLLWPMSMPWLVPHDLDDLLEPARRTLGEEEYAQIYAQGRIMSIEEAVAYALEEIG